MKGLDILKDIFDDKIIRIINVFLEKPDKKFSLMEIAKSANVSIATSFRIVDKLVSKGFVQVVMEEKSKLYILSRGEKSLTLLRIFKNEGTEISEFVEALKPIQQVKRIVLETRNQNEAHCFIVGDNIPETEIRKIVENIAKKNDYTIKFVALSEKQFNEMVQAGIYDLKEKVIWKR